VGFGLHHLQVSANFHLLAPRASNGAGHKSVTNRTWSDLSTFGEPDLFRFHCAGFWAAALAPGQLLHYAEGGCMLLYDAFLSVDGMFPSMCAQLPAVYLLQHAQAVLFVLLSASAHAFSPPVGFTAPSLSTTRSGAMYRQPFVPTPSPGLRTGTELDMFGWLKEAFSNEAYAKPAEGVKANAKHILVKNLEECTDLKSQVESGAMTFEDAARQFSTCPSSSQGGSLGNFKPGMMVPEFDNAVFGANSEGIRSPVGEVLGPVETKFGFHLIKIMSRSMPSKNVNGAFTDEVA
jgi:hypothetical protein